jgi:hypothetical protein
MKAIGFRRNPIIGLIILLVAVFDAPSRGSANNALHRIELTKACIGDEYIDFSKGVPLGPGFTTASPGTLIGTTWHDYQTNGSTGNRIAVDGYTGVHISWMNAKNDSLYNPRLVYYNYLNSYEEWLSPDEGIPVADISRGGYTTLDCFSNALPGIVFHYRDASVADSLIWLAIDSTVGEGRFYVLDLPDNIPGYRGAYWPYIAIDNSDNIHYVATEKESSPGDSKIICYANSTDMGASWNGPYMVDTVKNVSAICISSHVSNKVAIIYCHQKDDNYVNNDIYYVESQDGLSWDFADKHNITNYSVDDSIRAFMDLDALYDANDNLHIIWDTYYYYGSGADFMKSLLWHWSETTGTTLIATAWWPSEPGAWNLSISKMSVGGDFNGNLFAVWTQFNNTDVADNGYSNGDLFMAYSSDGGNNWSSPTNLTNTQTPGCLAGECDSDHWSSLAEEVGEYLHIMYINDKDAGGIPMGEGVATQNPVMHLAISNPLWAGPQLGTIIGTVTEEDAVTPIESVLVRALQNGPEVTSDVTDPDGLYTLSNLPVPILPVGLYDVEASKLGYTTQTVFGVEVTPNQTTTVDITLNEPNEPPSAFIDDISPNPAEEGENVSFTGHGGDPDGYIDGYNWSSSIDGFLSDQASFNTSALSVGIHVIYFKVHDNDGAWSEEVSEILEITHKPFYFIHITDTHYGYNGAREAVNRLIDEILTWDPKPAFVIVTGDILSWGWCSPGLPPVAWPFYEEESNDYSVFESDFQTLVDSGIPYFVCPGNHDYYDWPYVIRDLSKFDDHFPISYESEIIENSLHIISINSGSDELFESPFSPPKGNGLCSSDVEWMGEILDGLDGNPDNNCDVSSIKKVVMMHHPTINYLSGKTHGDQCLCWTIYPEFVYCDRWNAGVPYYNREQFKQLCDQYEVDVVCSGHIHLNRTYDATMDSSDWEGDQDGYDKVYCPNCSDPENYPLSTSDNTLYEYTGAAYHGAYRVLWVESDGIMVHDANVLDDVIIATVSGCPATLHLYDSTGNHVGRNDGVGVEFQIEHAIYSLMPIGDTVETDPTLWEHTEEEISIACGADDFRYELHGTGDGILFFSVKKDMPGGSYIRLFYDSLTVTATSIGKLYIDAGSLDYSIYMDDDGDGIIDREIQPDIVNVMLRGDANGDGQVNLADAVYIVNYLFIGGPPPDPLEAGDANCDGEVNLADAVYIINWLFIGGPPPGC